METETEIDRWKTNGNSNYTEKMKINIVSHLKCMKDWNKYSTMMKACSS